MEKGMVCTRMGYQVESEVSASGEPMVRVVKKEFDGRRTAMTFLEGDLEEMRKLMKSGSNRSPVEGSKSGS